MWKTRKHGTKVGMALGLIAGTFVLGLPPASGYGASATASSGCYERADGWWQGWGSYWAEASGVFQDLGQYRAAGSAQAGTSQSSQTDFGSWLDDSSATVQGSNGQAVLEDTTVYANAEASANSPLWGPRQAGPLAAQTVCGEGGGGGNIRSGSLSLCEGLGITDIELTEWGIICESVAIY